MRPLSRRSKKILTRHRRRAVQQFAQLLGSHARWAQAPFCARLWRERREWARTFVPDWAAEEMGLGVRP